MENTTATVEVLGRRIHELRGGSGKPLLYLHSAMGEAIWMPHLLALAQGRELHAPAHPGFLSSEGIEQIRDIEDVVEHYLAYLDVMGWSSVDVVGLSLGGWIAAELAARHPERVSALVLASAVGIWIRERPIADIFAIDTRYPERVKALLFHDVSCPAAQMMVSPANMELPEAMLVNILNAFAATARIGWNPLLHDPRLESLLPRVRARTLCLWGADDRVVPLAYGERFAKLVPGASLEVIPACGHLAPLEKQAEWVGAVKRFLG
ncbi:MAG TPA: alpha/beta hydrolase [Myxococcota bacterium]|jgi:pimeloyl-ACP methyl ester carboxylesterase|nr:alpha/beta hydrolase [Myxococcota bacterium]